MLSACYLLSQAWVAGHHCACTAQLDVTILLLLEWLLLPFWLCLSATIKHHTSASTSYAKDVQSDQFCLLGPA